MQAISTWHASAGALRWCPFTHSFFIDHGTHGRHSNGCARVGDTRTLAISASTPLHPFFLPRDGAALGCRAFSEGHKHACCPGPAFASIRARPTTAGLPQPATCHCYDSDTQQPRRRVDSTGAGNSSNTRGVRGRCTHSAMNLTVGSSVHCGRAPPQRHQRARVTRMQTLPRAHRVLHLLLVAATVALEVLRLGVVALARAEVRWTNVVSQSAPCIGASPSRTRLRLPSDGGPLPYLEAP